jgi:acetyl-CoA carboxylase, biotin carboxylase subunit
MFTKVLIANRGEIAVRVVRACRELGIASAVVYSTADRDTTAVQQADEAVCIGPGPSARSYLNIGAIIQAALIVGADAVHPGYGFLAEDPDFAEACERSGLTFVGPPARVLARLGTKARARMLMSRAGLPLLPGSIETIEDVTAARHVAEMVGYPLIIKAAAGGGGRGMRVVTDPADLAGRYRDVRIEAQKLFGDSSVYMERFLPAARHVEVQVLADRHGNAIHLGERDCSVQRRRQKLVEESPAAGLPEELVRQICEAAVRGVRAAEYVGAGTFEFLVDDAGSFAFMEVNCRIQVEHPVTEMRTGVDLVQAQLRAAAGERLTYRQEDVAGRGVALECRVNAEDPSREFAPTPGTLTRFEPPGGPFVRVDTHGFTGYRIPPHYDSLLAKVVVWAPDRAQAIARMDRALEEFRVDGPGIHTTGRFLRDVLDHPRFRAGTHDTGLVAEMTASDAVRAE